MELGKYKCIIIGFLGKVIVGYGIPGEGYIKIQVDEMREHITEKWKGTQHRRRDKGHNTKMSKWFVKDSQNPIILYLTKITQ